MIQSSRHYRWVVIALATVTAIFASYVTYEYGIGVSNFLGIPLHERGGISTESSATEATSNTFSSTVSSSMTYETPATVCANLPNPALGIASSDPNSSTAHFLIVEADIGTSYTGINGSYHHIDTNWPVITVYQGQQVTIHVVNCPQSPEPHGFAIGFYFASGVALSPGQSYTFTFVASTIGRFTVFCNIFCAIHQYMQNGELLVKPMPSG